MKRLLYFLVLCLVLDGLHVTVAQKPTKPSKVRKAMAVEQPAATGQQPADTNRQPAADATLPFKGTIQYKIAYESTQIPAEQLAAQPASATVKMTDTKLLMDTKVIKSVFNADDHLVYNMMNLSGIGLGKFVIVKTAAEMRDTSEMQDYELKPTDETKHIFGYTARKATGSWQTPEAEVHFELWYVEHFCPEFFHLIKPSFINLNGFPLEYTMSLKSQGGLTLKTSFTVEKMQYGEIEPSVFNIPAAYRQLTEAELQHMLEDLASALE